MRLILAVVSIQSWDFGFRLTFIAPSHHVAAIGSCLRWCALCTSGTTVRILAPEIFTLCFLALMQLHQFSHPKGWSCLGAGSKKSSRSLPATRIPSSWRRSVRHSLDWNPVTWKSAHLVTIYVTTPSHGVRVRAKQSLKSFGAMDPTNEHHTAWRRIFH